MDIDKYLDEIGTFGLWHLWVFSWIFVMVVFNAAINVAILFMNEIPDFVCENQLSSMDVDKGWSFAEIKHFSCPLNEKGSADCCFKYKMNYSDMTGNTFSQALTKYANFSSNSQTEVEKCNGPWKWHLTGMNNTAVTQWSLVCEDSVHIANMQLVFMLGFFFACSSFGFLADKFGRRITSAIALTLAGFFGIACSLVPHFYGFLLLRFLVGFFNSGSAQCLYVLALELCNDKLRKVMGAIFFVFYSFGYVGLAGIAYLVRDWRMMHLIISAPSCLGLLLFWFVNALVYYGISLLITSFSGNVFINNAISGALETPAYLLCYPLLWWARKKSLMISLILAGISGLLYLAVPPDVVWAQLLLAFVGKLCITASFNLVYVVTLELYPTPIRGTSLLFSSMAGRGGSIAAPYITLIAQTNRNLMAVPMVIFGISALIAGVLTCFIPESQGQPLPESLEDILHYPPKRKQPL